MERIRHYVERVDGKQYDRTERVSHNWSRSAFTLSDETGTLIVRPADADIVGAEQVYSRPEPFEPDGDDSTTGMVYVEHALPVGTTIFVHGEAHDWDENHVTIAKPRDGGPLILSTRPEYVLRGEAGEQRERAEAVRWQGYGLLTLAVALFALMYVF